MSRVEIEVVIGQSGNESRYILDTTEGIPIPLTLQISDITDISSTNSAYSKTIQLPETKNNCEAFGFISDLSISISEGGQSTLQPFTGPNDPADPNNSNTRFASQTRGGINPFSTFNPNKKARCYIMCDSVIVFEGYIQLNRIVKNKDKGINTLEVVVYAENDNLWTKIGDRYLTDIDFSQLNHDYTIASITASWYGSADDHGYFYPIIDYGDSGSFANQAGGGDWTLYDIGATHSINVANLYPSTYVKTILDRMFQQAGYQYTSNFFNSQRFKNLLIPFNGTMMYKSATFSAQQIFRAGMGDVNCGATSSTQSGGTWSMYLTQTGYNSLSPGSYNIGNIHGIGNIYTASNIDYTSSRVRIRMQNEAYPNSDVGGIWASSSRYDMVVATSPHGEPYHRVQRFGFQYTLIDWQPTGTSNPSSNTDGFRVMRSRLFGGATVSGYPNSGVQMQLENGNYQQYTGYNVSGQYQQVTATASGRIVTGSFYTGYTSQAWNTNMYPLYEGEHIWVEYQKGITVIATQSGTHSLATIGSNTTFWNETLPQVQEYEKINYNSAIPKNVKQRDFLTSLITMFNLFVEPDKANPNSLRIEPRDDYYAAGAIKDWSDKVDYNQDIEVDVPAEKQNRLTIFKYKDDKDYYNADYLARYYQTYGEYNYYTDNDNINGTKKIEVMFSPTPLATIHNSKGFVIPKIMKLNNNIWQRTDSNIRILQRSTAGLVENAWNETWRLGYTGQAPYATTFTSYPYVGHFDDPYDPDFDLNFGQTQQLYWGQDNATTNNLMANYWKKMMDEYTDVNSKIVIYNMYLTPVDIYNFSFADNIFIDNQYYKVLKIDGYDPSIKATCKVTMIKTIEITIPKTRTRWHPGPTSPVQSLSYMTQGPNHVGLITAIGSHNNQIFSGDSGVIGSGNVIGPDSPGSLIIGQDNQIIGQGPGSVIIGQGNMIMASVSAPFVSGNNNTVHPNTNSTIFGNNNISGTGSLSYVVGNGNEVAESVQQSIVIGHDNVVQSSLSNIYGSNNVIGTNSNARIFGNNNIFNDNVTNSVAIGKSITATQNDMVYISDFVFTGSGTGSAISLSNVLAIGGDTGGQSVYGTFSIDNVGSDTDLLKMKGTSGAMSESFTLQRQRSTVTSNATPVTLDTISIGGTDVTTIEGIATALRYPGGTAYTCKFYGSWYYSSGAVQMGSIDRTEKNVGVFSATAINVVVSGNDILLKVTGNSSQSLNWFVDYKITTMKVPI